MKFSIKITTLFSVAMLLGAIKGFGQQDPHFTQYMYNTMSVNPAYAGSTESLSVTALGRVQWVDVPGAPRSQTVSAHSPIGYSGLGAGMNISNDELGPASEIFVDGNVSYTVRMSDRSNLAIGLRLGGSVLNVDFDQGTIREDGDNAFANNVNNNFLPTVGAGIYYHTPKSYVGVSVPNFLKSKHVEDSGNDRINVAEERLHFFLIGGYVFDLNERIKLKPAFIAKAVSGAPLSFDVSANALFSERLTVGLAYRWEDAVSGLLGFQVSKRFFMGYAYDLTTSNYQSYNNGTHELMLRFNFLDGLRVKSPRFF